MTGKCEHKDEEQSRGRGEVRRQTRDGLETKFPQEIQAQRKAGNLMLSVRPEGRDCLFNAIGRHGGAAEKRAESFFGRDSEVAVTCRAEHDIVSRHPDASDPQPPQTMSHRTWALRSREGWRHRVAPGGLSHVQTQDPDK